MVQIHQEIRMTTIASTAATESFAHNWWLNATVSRIKAVVNAIVLSINNVRPTMHANTTGVIKTHDQRSKEYGRLNRIARVSKPRAL